MSDPLTGKRVVILGLARQGTALAKWLRSIGAEVVISDLRSAEHLAEPLQELEGSGVAYVLGEHPPYLLNGAQVLCVSGGVPLSSPIVQGARARQMRITNDAQLFLERCPCHVIGITGSAGKTTTTALVGKMLEASGRLPWVGGNIGNPLISDLPYIRPDDIVVMELSSFQLELVTDSPHIAAILNITPNHLDRHGTMENYIAAKARIIENQKVGDVAVLSRDDPNTLALAATVHAELSQFSANVPVDVGAWLVDDRIVTRPAFTRPMETICSISEIPLRGRHNVLNVLAATAIAGAAGATLEGIRNAILGFKPVEHRLETIRNWQGVTFVNDSIATAPERVMAAINAYPEPLVLLLGGKDKDLPWEEMLMLAVQRSRAIITFGEAGRMIAEKAARMRALGGYPTPIEQTSTLEDAFWLAASLAEEGDVVLLSPGCTSYDTYEDYAARGKHFRELVLSL